MKCATGSYVLTAMELYNWGSYNGLHHAPIDPAGTSLIGTTGSGKTTLIDAFMTLICANPRYNLASTGGVESDRDLVSYVRGASGPGESRGPKQQSARPGRTISGICATFRRGDEMVRLAALFSFEGTSSAATEMEKCWILTHHPEQTLESCLLAYHDEGKRGLGRIEKNVQNFWLHGTRKEYLARVRALFQVGDNAFSLLNRAAGIKQLTDIDSIFRELVLDDRSAFGRAAEVVKSFEDLSEIHQELEIARAQQKSLKPIAECWEAFKKQAESLQELKAVEAIAPVWFAEQSHQLWLAEKSRLDVAAEESALLLKHLADQRIEWKQQCDMHLQAYLQKGGASIDQLRKRVEEWENVRETRVNYSAQYQRLVRKLGLPEELSSDVLTLNKVHAAKQGVALANEMKGQRSETFQRGIVESDVRAQLLTLNQEIDEIKRRPGSNIPGEYHHFRGQLAAYLEVNEAELPFVAELVQVKPDEHIWRGAIERAIGGHRLRVLVSPEKARAALQWINSRDNHLHVRVLEVALDVEPRRFFEDGYARKLEFKSHPFRNAVEALIADNDRHCVADPTVLLSTPHAMTKEGLMSGKPHLYEKRDQRLLNAHWFTGFDNQDRLAYLNQEVATVDLKLAAAVDAVRAAQDRLGSLEDANTACLLLRDVEFNLIDLPGADNQLIDLKGQLDYLTRPDTDVALAKRLLDEAMAKRDTVEDAHVNANVIYALSVKGRDNAAAMVEKTLSRAELGMTNAERSAATKYLRRLDTHELQDLNDIERESYEALSKRISKNNDQLVELQSDLVRKMSDAKSRDTGALADVGRDLIDVPAYIERLRVLTEEALPQKVERFLTYLNRSSDDGVTQLLSYIDQEVLLIEERIDELNSTLRRVEFQSGKYLRLVTSKVVHESLRSLHASQRKLTSARFVNDTGETHYRALKSLIEVLKEACEKSRNVSARAMLDPRFRLAFSVSVVDSASGMATEGRKGSQGDSGGEKEIVASYVLTASLGYALCPAGESRPLFGTIVLDEAFSKSSPSVAARIIAALKEFGLHAIFITPNKELRLLRLHTRSAIVVHKKDGLSTMVSMSWEALENYYRARKGKGDTAVDSPPSEQQ